MSNPTLVGIMRATACIDRSSHDEADERMKDLLLQGADALEALEPAPNVLKLYEVSTGHVPQEIAQAIDGGYFAHKPAMVREEGWLFSVPEEDVDRPEGLNSKAFDAIMAHARVEGCAWVLFDRDVELVSHHLSFDW